MYFHTPVWPKKLTKGSLGWAEEQASNPLGPTYRDWKDPKKHQSIWSNMVFFPAFLYFYEFFAEIKLLFNNHFIILYFPFRAKVLLKARLTTDWGDHLSMSPFVHVFFLLCPIVHLFICPPIFLSFCKFVFLAKLPIWLLVLTICHLPAKRESSSESSHKHVLFRHSQNVLNKPKLGCK